MKVGQLVERELIRETEELRGNPPQYHIAHDKSRDLASYRTQADAVEIPAATA
jgi:hypothetical protein